MTDSEKLKLVTRGLLDLAKLLGESSDNDEQERVIVEEPTKPKKRGRPKKAVIATPVKEKKIEVEEEYIDPDVHIIKKSDKMVAANKRSGDLVTMNKRTSPMEFLDNGVEKDKLDKKPTYLPKVRKPRIKKPYKATLVKCSCDKCGKKCEVDAVFAPRPMDSQDDEPRFFCDNCLRKMGR